MSDVNQLAAFLRSADNPDPAESETTGGTDESLEAQDPVEVEDDEPETEQASDVAEPDEQDDESDPVDWYSVKVGGEELQVTLDEALKGYQRDADYRKKTMTLAEERKALDAEKNRIGELIGEAESFIKREEQIDWDELQERDPNEYIARKKELEKAKKVHEEATQEQQKQMQELLQKETTALIEKMGGDEWTQDQRNTDLQTASEYLKGHGFEDQDISKIIDHRLWTVIMDAAKAAKHQKTEAKVKESVRKAPKSVKPGQSLPASERKRKAATNKIGKARNSREQVDALAEYLKLQG